MWRFVAMAWFVCLLGCGVRPSQVAGLRSPSPLEGEAVQAECWSVRAETARCRVEQLWVAGEGAEALPPQPPSRRLRAKPLPPGAKRSSFEVSFRAEPALFERAAPVWRHPLTSRAFGLRTCAFRGGCPFDVGILTTGAGVPASVRYHGLSGDAAKGVPWGTAKTRRGWWLKFRGPERGSAPGGPTVGAGVVWRDGARPRTSVGWAFYAPDWAEHTLNLELEPGRVQLVPATSLVSPGFLVLPSAGIGIGVPFRVQPDLAAGMRMQASLGVPYVVVSGALDIFPGDKAWAQPSVMVSLSL